jgi:hypothetical protein
MNAMIEDLGWWITGKPAGSGGLIHHEELVWLRERRIGTIVSLTERSLHREKLLLHRLDSLGFAYRCIPVIDETAPSQVQVDEFANFERTAGAGIGCARDCRGGYGQTGKTLGCAPPCRPQFGTIDREVCGHSG